MGRGNSYQPACSGNGLIMDMIREELNERPSQRQESLIQIGRREFLATTGTVAVPSLVPAAVCGANERLNIGGKVRVSSMGPRPNSQSGPTWMITKFEIGPHGKRSPVDVFWYEGTAKPPEPVARELPTNESLFIGDKGRIAIVHGGMPLLLPAARFKDFQPPKPYLPESPGHHQQWINDCKTGSPTGSHFDYTGPFTEIVLLGNVAYRIGETIEYDLKPMKVTHIQAANDLLSKDYHRGWELSE